MHPEQCRIAEPERPLPAGAYARSANVAALSRALSRARTRRRARSTRTGTSRSSSRTSFQEKPATSSSTPATGISRGARVGTADSSSRRSGWARSRKAPTS
ncbi:hypothetical protein ACIQ64_31280 [Streptomyces sp. NPDC094473]|uniref:hypothetical protein n=1 Tax=Streptomyces sp. NPDC094473 TaxID=3366068 RepID=UPI00382D5597